MAFSAIARYLDNLARAIVNSIFKISIAAVLMALVIQFSKILLAKVLNLDTFLGIFGRGFVAGMLDLGVFVLAAYLLRTHELIAVIAIIKRKLWKKASHQPIWKIPASRCCRLVNS